MVPKANNNYCDLCEESECVCIPDHFTPGNNPIQSPSSDLGKNSKSSSDLDSKQNPSSDLGTPKSSSDLAAKDNSTPNTELGPDGKPWDDTVDFEETDADPESPDESAP
ncbi:hypothetical protein GEMRC1_005175 [Eukaryota sp. GEM-RC1]